MSFIEKFRVAGFYEEGLTSHQLESYHPDGTAVVLGRVDIDGNLLTAGGAVEIDYLIQQLTRFRSLPFRPIYLSDEPAPHVAKACGTVKRLVVLEHDGNYLLVAVVRPLSGVRGEILQTIMDSNQPAIVLPSTLLIQGRQLSHLFAMV